VPGGRGMDMVTATRLEDRAGTEDESSNDTPSMRAHVDACFDTNIALEISTIVDLNRAARASRLLAPSVVRTRRDRARASLAAAWLCQTRGLRTFSLRDEVDVLLKRLAPDRTPEGAHPWFFTWFLRDYVLPDWQFGTSEAPDALDRGMSGNARDRHLVALARKYGVPLVTHEFKPNGAIARAAATPGVQVMTSSQWVSSLGGGVGKLALELLAHACEQMLVFICTRQEFERAALESCQAYVEILELILDESEEPLLPDPLDSWPLFGENRTR